jgi:hypothetical protein
LPRFVPSNDNTKEHTVEEERTLQEHFDHEETEAEFVRTDEEVLVHAWRTEQLLRLGLSRVVAEGFAGRVDWHDISALVARGCPPELALDILY